MRTNKNNGAALISALFITAICAIIATALALSGSVIIRTGELVKSADQGYLNLQSIQDWARHQINLFNAQWAGLQGSAPGSLRPMTWRLQSFKLDNKTLSAEIFDAQGRYNLNNLVDSANQPQFAALIMAVSPDVSQKQAYAIAQAVTDWMTKGDLDKVYLKQKPAYRAPRHPMADKTELRLVEGVSAALYKKLSAYIVALPVSSSVNTASSTGNVSNPNESQSDGAVSSSTTLINLNGATWPIFMSLSPGLTEDKAKALVACRKRNRYFTSVDAFASACENTLGVKPISNLTTHSQYYLLKSVAVKEQVALHLDSLLMSQVDKRNKITVKVIWQSFY